MSMQAGAEVAAAAQVELGEGIHATVDEAVAAAKRPASALGVFERWLSAWVALCIVAGIALGNAAPGLFEALRKLPDFVVEVVLAGKGTPVEREQMQLFARRSKRDLRAAERALLAGELDLVYIDHGAASDGTGLGVILAPYGGVLVQHHQGGRRRCGAKARACSRRPCALDAGRRL